uniref:Chaperone DnaJ n=1 Tax=Ganoderma boninense TaxID=34458 RepID=A0A5K1K1K3_9APHY|nr:Chaperone DnaJ [Ganoderma boninense]
MMASRFARRVASQSLRSASRVSSRPAAPAARRFATTDAAHGAKESSDTPWMIGSALVFGPVVRSTLLRLSGERETDCALATTLWVDCLPALWLFEEGHEGARPWTLIAQRCSRAPKTVQPEESSKEASAPEPEAAPAASDDSKAEDSPAPAEAEATTPPAEAAAPSEAAPVRTFPSRGLHVTDEPSVLHCPLFCVKVETPSAEPATDAKVEASEVPTSEPAKTESAPSETPAESAPTAQVRMLAHL